LRPTMWVWMLTGTPASQSPTDAYGLAKIINPSGVPKFFGAFRDMVMQRITTFKWIPKFNSEKTVHEVLQPAIRFTKEECLDLPPLTKEQIFVELSIEQAKVYQAMKRDFIAYIGGKACVAQLALTKALRLMQIVSGFAAVEGDTNSDVRTDLEFDSTPRLSALKELLEQITPLHKVIVWACWRQNYKAIRGLLSDMGIQHSEVHGEFNHGEKQQAVDIYSSRRLANAWVHEQSKVASILCFLDSGKLVLPRCYLVLHHHFQVS